MSWNPFEEWWEAWRDKRTKTRDFQLLQNWKKLQKIGERKKARQRAPYD